jgi:hypothetical protein
LLQPVISRVQAASSNFMPSGASSPRKWLMVWLPVSKPAMYAAFQLAAATV